MGELYNIAAADRLSERGENFECGCGTGALTLRLNKAGYDVTGSDISRDMLEVAAEKSRRCGQKTKFICMDMRRIELHRPVDCIIAACDCVNYLTSREDVENSF